MRERVAEAMYTVWGNRCRELCRDVEFGGATQHCGCHFIKFARPQRAPHLLVGVWHIKRVGPGDFEVVADEHFNPPMKRDRLGPGYRELFYGFEHGGKWVMIPNRKFTVHE